MSPRIPLSALPCPAHLRGRRCAGAAPAHAQCCGRRAGPCPPPGWERREGRRAGRKERGRVGRKEARQEGGPANKPEPGCWAAPRGARPGDSGLLPRARRRKGPGQRKSRGGCGVNTVRARPAGRSGRGGAAARREWGMPAPGSSGGSGGALPLYGPGHSEIDLHPGRCGLGSRKNSFTQGVIRYWKGLPRAVVGPHPWRCLRKH